MNDRLGFYEKVDIDLQKIVDEQAQKVQRYIDEATLKQVEDRLAEFGYVKVDEKNQWSRLYGTPERAARTLEIRCDPFHCVVCPAYHHNCGEGDYDALLKWLKDE